MIIVDMTRAFVDSTYPSGFSPTGYPCVAANAALLETARRTGVPVFFTKGYADENYEPKPPERGRWKSLGTRSDPLREGTPPGDVIVEDLTPQSTEIVICKGGKPSGFSGTPLASYMIYEACDTAIVTGMTTSGCVRATLLDAFQANFHCLVPYECVADRSQISHKVNLFDMHMKYADIVSLEETLEYLEKLAVS
ncbi:MAG: isochorismatase family protein [Acidimicrobiaceae bacterium]|nr:isochorismatase family protein [Acidimicrobiaceae bacterium]